MGTVFFIIFVNANTLRTVSLTQFIYICLCFELFPLSDAYLFYLALRYNYDIICIYCRLNILCTSVLIRLLFRYAISIVNFPGKLLSSLNIGITTVVLAFQRFVYESSNVIARACWLCAWNCIQTDDGFEPDIEFCK